MEHERDFATSRGRTRLRFLGYREKIQKIYRFDGDHQNINLLALCDI
jgi:hypothetical protein